ncbi:MAG: c-type cytochrome biogenesis protein CcmI [Paracoccaceae bacterium]
MTPWIILAIFAATAAVLISVPFIRRPDTGGADANRSLSVYRDQLAEVERQQAAGQIDAEAARLAKAEIERRFLNAARDIAPPARGFSAHARFAALGAIFGLVVGGATTLYMVTGRSDLPAAPFAADQLSPASPLVALIEGTTTGGGGAAESGGQVGDVEGMIAGLAARLEANPEDADGWRMLGWSYFNTERYGKAAEAYARAAALSEGDADTLSAYGEALVRAADGLVTDEAAAVFDRTLAVNSQDARARFFKGLALEQSGDPAGAVEAWLAVLDDAPPGAEWVENLRLRVSETAVNSGIDVSGRLMATDTVPALPAVPPGGPTAEDVRSASQMTEEDRQAMIAAMVERLAARLEDNPADPDGWIRLARSRLVLEDRDAALAALDRARAQFSGQPAELAKITAAAKELGLTTTE